ncbi:MAG: hypothetical protein H7Y03_04465 [Chitinophagaceae bacterium]|nr:hypothetical protein [Chitinophagaceae bacterium]
MILKNRQNTSGYFLLLVTLAALFNACNYSFKDISIPPEVKTARVNFIENKARYVNPQLSPQLTDRLRQKINNQTRLTQVQGDDAHYEINARITDYTVTTVGVANGSSNTNRLRVAVHIKLTNRLDEKKNFEGDVSRNFDFDANQSLQQAEAAKNDEIVRNITDEIFNILFSNW